MNVRRAAAAARPLAAVAACLALAALLGCGDSNKSSVSGKVTYKNAPVTGGMITLTPDGSGQNASITIKPDGTFLTDSVVPGKYKVSVSTEGIGSGAPLPQGSSPPGGLDPNAGMKKVEIPKKYENPNSSPIPPWEIKPGGNNKTLDLTD